MSIIFIGDPGVGKTTLVVELAKPSPSKSVSRYVEVLSPSYEELNELRQRRQREDGTEVFETTATEGKQVRELQIRVELPTGSKRDLQVQWVDTPGELWKNNRENPSNNSREEWEELLSAFQAAKGIILVLSPHCNRLKSQHVRQAWLETQDLRQRFFDYEEWIQNFDNWLNFLSQNVKISQQVIICLNKADLFCEDCEAVTQKLPLEPSNLDIKKIQDYFLENYFQEVQDRMTEYHRRTQGNSLNVFITTKDNRLLLESPWIYLARLIRN